MARRIEEERKHVIETPRAIQLSSVHELDLDQERERVVGGNGTFIETRSGIQSCEEVNRHSLPRCDCSSDSTVGGDIDHCNNPPHNYTLISKINPRGRKSTLLPYSESFCLCDQYN